MHHKFNTIIQNRFTKNTELVNRWSFQKKKCSPYIECVMNMNFLKDGNDGDRVDSTHYRSKEQKFNRGQVHRLLCNIFNLRYFGNIR